MNDNLGDVEKDLNNSTDSDLLRAFIGKNYDKLTTNKFNFAGFFFTTFYMFYRKMFLYGILWFIVNLIIINFIEQSKQFIVTLLLSVVVGFCVNKLYLYHANKKIAKIKLKNPQKECNELKEICASKGGTSAAKVLLGLITEIGIATVILVIMFLCGIGGTIAGVFNLANWNITTDNNKNDINNFDSINNRILLEDISVNGSWTITNGSDSKREFYFYVDGEYYVSEDETINLLVTYKEYIKLNIYYVENEEKRVIVDYKALLKSNNEDITHIKTEDELRTKIGLYTTGINTDSFTLSEIGTGIGMSNTDGETYYYKEYVFVDSQNNEYEMKYMSKNYITDNNELELIVGNKYNITFEVVKDESWEKYEYYIKSIN